MGRQKVKLCLDYLNCICVNMYDLIMIRKEGNIFFNDTLNTFYLWLYGVIHMVKDHSDCKGGNPLLPHGLLFRLAATVLLYASSHRQDNTHHSLCYTSRGILAGTKNVSDNGSVITIWMNEWMFNETPARKTDWLLGVTYNDIVLDGNSVTACVSTFLQILRNPSFHLRKPNTPLGAV